MAHPLGQVSDAQHPTVQHEVKLQPPLDDPLQAYASEAQTKAEQQSSAGAAHTKPIRIPNSILDELRDPEATPTAANAFPQTPTSSSSLRAASPALTTHEEGDDTVATDTRTSDAGDNGASASGQGAEGGPSVSAKTSSIASLRAKVCKAAARGDLESLINILHPSDSSDNANGDSTSADYPSSFALVNSPTASGQTPLLEAASHGHLHIIHHLLTEEGAVRDLEDIEGENAFLKASYKGHLHIMKYLAEGEDGTDVNVADQQGWTALHNAASKGYLEVAMWLAENGAIIDVKSSRGYTPLMNAASKGHLPIVRYLLSKHLPNPFIRNAYNETAYDVAVATFEFGIADILASYENQLWQDRQSQSHAGTSTSTISSTCAYNPLGMHITVPVIVYENQRLDLRWLSRTKRSMTNPIASTSNASPTPSGVKFTSSALSRRDGHASSELPPSYDGLNRSSKWIPVKRSDIKLPSILNPRQIRLPTSSHMRPTLQRNANSANSTGKRSSSISTTSSATSPSISEVPETTEEAWFWLSTQFFVDLSPNNIDPQQGWQYAKSFDTSEEDWQSEMPIEVVRILSGEVPSRGTKWVRRRRWARIMRRRIDIPHWGFDDDNQPTASDDHDSNNFVDGQSSEGVLLAARDYLERAQYFAGSYTRRHAYSGSQNPNGTIEEDSTSVKSLQTVIADAQAGQDADESASGRRVIARLERALLELRQGIEDDQDEVRKLQAVTLADIFRERLEELQQRYPSTEGIDDDAESFRYPGADDDSELDETSSISTSLRSASLYSPISHGSPASFRRSSDAFSLPYGSPASRQQATLHPSSSSASIYRPDLSRQLSSNPDFRVPTSEEPRNTMPSKYTLGRTIFDSDSRAPDSQTPSHPNVRWEPDESTQDCRRCHRKFTFFLRKHHCRKCGLVVCAHCSSHNDFLRSDEVIREPGSSNDFDPLYGIYYLEGGIHRTCDVCHEEIRNATSTIDTDLLLAPNYFTSPRLGASSLGPTTSSTTAGAPTPTLAHYPQAVDNHLAPAGVGSVHVGEQQGDDGSPMQRSVSDLSELGECPVCGTNLEDIPDKAEQESHIQNCLESGTSSRVQDNRYLVFTLPDSSPLVGTDCLICFESYEAGEQIGRLSCLCHFHRHCIANWLSRGKSCPVHAR